MPPTSQNASNDDLRSRLDARFHGPLMTFFCRRVKDRNEAEDLTQETLLRVISSHALERADKPESYVFQIAMNLLRDRYRDSARPAPGACISIDEAVAAEIEHQLVEDFSPERVLVSKDSLKEALAVLGQLGERTRDIYLLFRLENMKQKDIAALYGIGQSTVEKHVMRAVAHLAAWRKGRTPL